MILQQKALDRRAAFKTPLKKRLNKKKIDELSTIRSIGTIIYYGD